MFEIIGYLIGLIIISFVVTILTELTKRFEFITKLAEFFKLKVEKISWYHIETIIIALIILIILNVFGAITFGTFVIILSSIAIGLLSNGLFTYQLLKDLMLKFNITTKIIEIVETTKTKTTKTTKKK